MPAVNDLLLGVLLYQSRLVPRVLPLIAFIGAPLLLASDLAVLFGLWGRDVHGGGARRTPGRGI